MIIKRKIKNMDFENEYSFQVMDNEVKVFGKEFVKYAMNKTLNTIRRDIDGSCTAPASVELRKKLESFSPEQTDTLKEFIKEAVKSCMFNMMVMLNESDNIRLLVNSDDGDKEIKEFSDGLEGDLWSWIEWWVINN